MTEPVWMTHDMFEKTNALEQDYALQAARKLELHGQPSRREFPCLGDLVLLDDDGATHRAVCCDACRFETTIKRSDIDPALIGMERVARAHLPVAMVGLQFEPTPHSELARSALRRYVERWRDTERPKVPLLVGKCGRGKTHLLTLAAESLARTHHVVLRYFSTAELLDALKRSYDRNAEWCAEWERAVTVPLLVLDDLGAEHMTDWSRERMSTLIDARYRAQLPVLAATNVPVEEWQAQFGGRTASRLSGMTLPVTMEGPDRRQQTVVPSGAPNTTAVDAVLQTR